MYLWPCLPYRDLQDSILLTRSGVKDSLVISVGFAKAFPETATDAGRNLREINTDHESLRHIQPRRIGMDHIAPPHHST